MESLVNNCARSLKRRLQTTKNTKMWLDSDVDQTPWLSWKTSPRRQASRLFSYLERVFRQADLVDLLYRSTDSLGMGFNPIESESWRIYPTQAVLGVDVEKWWKFLYVFHVLFVAGLPCAVCRPFRAQNLKKLQDEKHLPAGRVGIFQWNSWCFFVLPRVIQDRQLFYDHGGGMYLHEGWHEGIWFLLPSHEKEGQTMIPMAKLVWSKVPTCPHNRITVPYI